MKLVCDENVRGSIVQMLEQEGYDVERVQESLTVGFDDRDIVAHCRTDGRVILTNDDDFFEFDSHPGILFLTEQRVSPRDVAAALERIEHHVDAETMENRVLHVPDGWI